MKQLKWEFTIASNGLEAVEACRNKSFDLVLMDIDMPVMDGIEATRNIRAFNSGIPIIAVTSYADQGTRAEIILAGMNDFLAKPCGKNEIYAIASSSLKNNTSK